MLSFWLQGVSKLTRLLLARAQPKRIGFVPVSGAMLAGLAEAYSAAINEGAVPTIATAWQVRAHSSCFDWVVLLCEGSTGQVLHMVQRSAAAVCRASHAVCCSVATYLAPCNKFGCGQGSVQQSLLAACCSATWRRKPIILDGTLCYRCRCVCRLPQGVAEAECRRAAAAAEDAYRLEFNVEGTPAEPEALLEEHLVSIWQATAQPCWIGSEPQAAVPLRAAGVRSACVAFVVVLPAVGKAKLD